MQPGDTMEMGGVILTVPERIVSPQRALSWLMSAPGAAGVTGEQMLRYQFGDEVTDRALSWLQDLK